MEAAHKIVQQMQGNNNKQIKTQYKKITYKDFTPSDWVDKYLHKTNGYSELMSRLDDYSSEMSWNDIEPIAKRSILTIFKLATRQDYLKFLSVYIYNGGKVDGSLLVKGRRKELTFESLRPKYYLANKDFKIFPFYGAVAINIIMITGAKCLNNCDRGHNNIFGSNGSCLTTVNILPKIYWDLFPGVLPVSLLK